MTNKSEESPIVSGVTVCPMCVAKFLDDFPEATEVPESSKNRLFLIQQTGGYNCIDGHELTLAEAVRAVAGNGLPAKNTGEIVRKIEPSRPGVSAEGSADSPQEKPRIGSKKRRELDEPPPRTVPKSRHKFRPKPG